MRMFVHHEDKPEPEVIEVEAETTVAEALGISIEEETVVLLLEDDDRVIDISLTVVAAEIPDRGHVHHGHHRHLEVIVDYNGEDRRRQFAASARVSRVYEWAAGKDGFELDETDAAEHQLALPGSNTVPAPDTHVGSLPQNPAGTVHLNIISKGRHEG
jgi:hypothetical protein